MRPADYHHGIGSNMRIDCFTLSLFLAGAVLSEVAFPTAFVTHYIFRFTFGFNPFWLRFLVLGRFPLPTVRPIVRRLRGIIVTAVSTAFRLARNAHAAPNHNV